MRKERSSQSCKGRKREREKKRLTGAQREKDRAVDCDLAFAPIAISRSTAPFAIARSVDRDLVKRWLRSREAPRRSQSRFRANRDLAKHRADCSPLSNLVASLCSFFSQFDRIWWFFFSGFCLCFCIKEWMILYIRLTTKKMWATSRKCVFYGIFKNTTNQQKIFFEMFFKMQPNTWKHFLFRKISFPKNGIFFENAFTLTKRSLNLKMKKRLWAAKACHIY